MLEAGGTECSSLEEKQCGETTLTQLVDNCEPLMKPSVFHFLFYPSDPFFSAYEILHSGSRLIRMLLMSLSPALLSSSFCCNSAKRRHLSYKANVASGRLF